jgi:DNA mismatch repair protein MutL
MLDTSHDYHTMNLTETEIQILPDFIANQIAAGEVVQRPESVIKELVENSLDAGATEITVIVRGAGKQLLHVIDNGKGMLRADLELAPKRHATSKIKTTDDLARIMTLGFRGEALASICSVAHVEIRSRRSGTTDNVGWKLTAEPMQEPALEPIAMDVGTQVFVRNLFYNVPARRKFLRSDLTEFRHIAETMTRFVLSRPDVRFTFYDDDKLLYDLKAASLHERIVSALGERFAAALMRVEYTDAVNSSNTREVNKLQTPLQTPLHITGYIGQPQFAKRTKAEQFFYLNGRSIASRQLSHAVMSAYEHLIDQSSYPPFVLMLELDPAHVDVNIHPQKHEVKFDDDRTMYTAIRRAVSETLGRYNLTNSAQFRTDETGAAGASSGRMTLTPQTPSDRFNSRTDDFVTVNTRTGEVMERGGNSGGNSGGSGGDGNSRAVERYPQYPQYSAERRITPREMSTYEALFGKETDGTTNNPSVQGRTNQAFTPQHNNDTQPNDTQSNDVHSNDIQSKGTYSSHSGQKFYWQLHKKYILTPTQSGVAVIDQHAAHERILYERALKAMNNTFKYAQELLFPVAVEMTAADVALVQELNEDLAGLGFDAHFTDMNHLEIRAVPADVRTGREEDALRELLEQYREYSELRHTSVRDNLAASFGCRSAIRAGDALSIQEMRQLADDLYASEMPYACPHGRPTVIEIPLGEFDNRFGRSS